MSKRKENLKKNYTSAVILRTHLYKSRPRNLNNMFHLASQGNYKTVRTDADTRTAD